MNLNTWRSCVLVFSISVLGWAYIAKETIELPGVGAWGAVEAAWVQAVGSVLALFVAIYVSSSQIRFGRRQQEIEAYNKRKSRLAVVEFAAQQGQAISNHLESLGHYWEYPGIWEGKFSTVIDLSLDSLKGIPVHELGDTLAILAYCEIYTNLACIQSESIALVAALRANKSVTDRAQAIHTAAAQLKGDFLNFQIYYRVAPVK